MFLVMFVGCELWNKPLYIYLQAIGEVTYPCCFMMTALLLSAQLIELAQKIIKTSKIEHAGSMLIMNQLGVISSEYKISEQNEQNA